jgi:hypothetical protein
VEKIVRAARGFFIAAKNSTQGRESVKNGLNIAGKTPLVTESKF